MPPVTAGSLLVELGLGTTEAGVVFCSGVVPLEAAGAGTAATGAAGVGEPAAGCTTGEKTGEAAVPCGTVATSALVVALSDGPPEVPPAVPTGSEGVSFVME